MLGIELLYAYFNTSSSDIAEVYEDSDWDLEYFLEKELLVLLDAFAVRGVRAWCSSVVFERGVRAWCSSAKRENTTRVGLWRSLPPG